MTETNVTLWSGWNRTTDLLNPRLRLDRRAIIHRSTVFLIRANPDVLLQIFLQPQLQQT